LRIEMKSAVLQLTHRVDGNLGIEVEVVLIQDVTDLFRRVPGDADDLGFGAAGDGEPHYRSAPQIMERTIFDTEPLALPLEGAIEAIPVCPGLPLRMAEDFGVGPGLKVGVLHAGSFYHGIENGLERANDRYHHTFARLARSGTLLKLAANELA